MPINIFYQFDVAFCDIPLLKNQNNLRLRRGLPLNAKKDVLKPSMASATSCPGNLFCSVLEEELEDYSRQQGADRNGNEPGNHDPSGHSPFDSGEALG